MAVYTHLTESEIRELLAQYELGELRAAYGIAEGIENTNYLLVLDDPSGKADKQKVILTLFEKRVAETDLPYYLGVMGHLAERGIPCPQPIETTDGHLFTHFKGRPATLVTFMEGQGVRGIYNEHMGQLGSIQARMHLAADSFPLHRRNSLGLAGWRQLFEKIAPRADEVTPGLCSMIEAELEFLEAHKPRDLPQGIIHADLFPDNVFFFREKSGIRLSGVIDFYFACNDILAYELAICLNAWCFQQHHEFNITRARLMLQGYQSVRPLTPEEREALPVLARGAALRFLLTRTHDWLFRVEGALVNPKDPMEYIKKLRFHQQVRGVGEYGL